MGRTVSCNNGNDLRVIGHYCMLISHDTNRPIVTRSVHSSFQQLRLSAMQVIHHIPCQMEVYSNTH